MGSDRITGFTNEYPFYVEEVVNDWDYMVSEFFCYTKEDMQKLINDMETV